MHTVPTRIARTDESIDSSEWGQVRLEQALSELRAIADDMLAGRTSDGWSPDPVAGALGLVRFVFANVAEVGGLDG